ncbi:MAG: hypothetical protein IPN22_11295 [Bacteroidetes bacterium]|nr:hypothetical protein [Bacteroidota bacterium]
MHLRFARWSKWRFAIGDFSAIQQESVFWRRTLWQKVGGHLTEGIIAYDLELWTRFFQHAQLFTLNIILAGFRVHPTQVSAIQRSRYSSESEKIISSYIRAINGQSIKNKIRKKLARTARVLYYYQVPYLEGIFRWLIDLPDYIDYCLETERFILRSK